MSDIWLVYSTFPNRDEAVSVSKALLEGKLVACANIHSGITSLYHWQGELKEEQEVVLIAKTVHEKLQAASEMIKEMHSYDTPCIVAWPIGGGYPPFLDWVEEQTQG